MAFVSYIGLREIALLNVTDFRAVIVAAKRGNKLLSNADHLGLYSVETQVHRWTRALPSDWLELVVHRYTSALGTPSVSIYALYPNGCCMTIPTVTGIVWMQEDWQTLCGKVGITKALSKVNDLRYSPGKRRYTWMQKLSYQP